jgi:hypothetical protein
MKSQAEIHELESKIDFKALNHSLLERLASGELGQRKSTHTLLDHIGDTLLELRRKRVTLREIVRELKAHGLEVSEGRLRAYLRSRGKESNQPPARRTKRKAPVQPPTKRTGQPGAKGSTGRDAPSLNLG